MNINTPAIASAIRKDVTDEYDAMLVKNDWKMHEGEKCSVCDGHGKDIEAFTMPCKACDGTGYDYEFWYGVEDGKPFVTMKQHGLEAIKELCKEYRSEEIQGMKRASRSMHTVFLLPSVCRIELMAAGIDVDRYEQEGNMRVLAKEVQKRWPELMTTNMINF